MRRDRHSLQALRVFATVAQAGSVTAGASLCGMTQGAATKQLKSLEESLGATLFERSSRGTELTPAGIAYLKAVKHSLQTLDDAAARLSTAARRAEVITLGSAPAVAQRWLISRIDELTRRCGVPVRLVPRMSREEAAAHANYAEIRFGEGRFPGWSARHLIGTEYRIVVSPGQHQRLARKRVNTNRMTRALLQSMPLLYHVLGPHIWDEVLAAMRLRADGAGFERVGFEQYSVLIPAAVAGHGIALVPSFLIEDEMRDGQLVAIGRPVQCSTSFWLLLVRGTRRTPHLERFVAALLQIAAHSEPRDLSL